MKKLIMLVSFTALFILVTAPAQAQNVNSTQNAATDQYDSGPTIDSVVEDAIQDIISGQGADVDGAAAYEAALNAAAEAGADEETAKAVAKEAVSSASEEAADDEQIVANQTGLTELPDTGGASAVALGAGILLVGGGLLACRLSL